MSKRPTIDLEEMQMAFEDRDGEGKWFLDLESGEVIRVHEDLDEQIDDGDERYVGIPYQGSQAGFRDMAEFVASVTDSRLRALLDVALQGKGAFRRFKDVLLEVPEERERWFAFQRECMQHRIRRWLETEGIEAELKTRPITSS